MSSDTAPASTALVMTDRPARYGGQLTSHLSRRLTTSWDADEQSGVVEFDDGRCDLSCTPDGLLMQVRLRDETGEGAQERVAHMEDVIGRHLVRFGARDELVARWQRADGSPGSVQVGASDPTP